MDKYNFLQSFTFKNDMKIPNRIVMAPMTTTASFHDGHVTNDEINYYSRCAYDAGIIITGVANVSENGKAFEGELSITDDKFIPGLRNVSSAIQKIDSKEIIQIFHAGRISNSKILRGNEIDSASNIPALRKDAEIPRELTEEEIITRIEDFEKATLRVIKSDFDGIELHGANTYLLQQFFSPHSNRRTDKWGGTLNNRMRFSKEIINKAASIIEKHATKPFLLGYHFSPEEMEIPGITFEDTLQFVEILTQLPLDYLHISLGEVWQTSIHDKVNTEPLSKRVLQITKGKIPLIVVGSVETPKQASQVIDHNFDFVALGKELILEPNWIRKIIANEEEAIRISIIS